MGNQANTRNNKRACARERFRQIARNTHVLCLPPHCPQAVTISLART